MTTLEKVKLQRDLANNQWFQGYYTARQLDTGDVQEILAKYEEAGIALKLIAEDEGLDLGPFLQDFFIGGDHYIEEINDMQQAPYNG